MSAATPQELTFWLRLHGEQHGLAVDEAGGHIVAVAVSGQAAEAGVRSGDVILRIDGRTVPDLQAARALLSGKDSTEGFANVQAAFADSADLAAERSCKIDVLRPASAPQLLRFESATEVQDDGHENEDLGPAYTTFDPKSKAKPGMLDPQPETKAQQGTLDLAACGRCGPRHVVRAWRGGAGLSCWVIACGGGPPPRARTSCPGCTCASSCGATHDTQARACCGRRSTGATPTARGARSPSRRGPLRHPLALGRHDAATGRSARARGRAVGMF